MKQCSFCKKTVYRIAGHGLCAACYYREKRNGTPEYVKVRKPCSVAGCEGLSVAKGLCEMHYRRMKRRGVVEGERFDKWGHAESHPLYHSHRNLIRTKVPMVPEWAELWNFVRDVGERPSPKHRLMRRDRSLPIGPDNFLWQAPLTDIPTTERADRAQWMRVYRAMNPRKFRDTDLRRMHGISLDEYEARLASQKGVCAICRKPESALHPKDGTPRNLAVDHCHQHGHLRGLLCSACNTAIGLLNDDPELAVRAAKYLASHKPASE